VYTYRLVYPTLVCASMEHTFLCDVRTGSLLQTINTHLPSFRYLDVNERHAFICEQDVMRVFSRESGLEVLRIPADATVRCSQRVEDPSLISGDWFTTPLSVSPEVDESPRPVFLRGESLLHFSSRIKFMLTSYVAHVSGDGRDLVVLCLQHRVIFIQDFERICRGETTFEQVALVLGIRPEDSCYDLGFKDGRVCVATVRISQTPIFHSHVGFRLKGSIFSPSTLTFRRRLRSCDPSTAQRRFQGAACS
jgi:hypothetical protein